MSLPIVDEITALPSQAARADWMIQCPDWHFMGFIASIRSALEDVNFPEAIAYLEARLACLQAVRTPAGTVPNLKLVPLYIREGEMREAGRIRDGGAIS